MSGKLAFLTIESVLEQVARFAPDECWVLGAARGGTDLPRLAPETGQTRASRPFVHRWLYARLVGPVPDTHKLYRTCATASCVNPRHRTLKQVRCAPLVGGGKHGYPKPEETNAVFVQACDFLGVEEGYHLDYSRDPGSMFNRWVLAQVLRRTGASLNAIGALLHREHTSVVTMLVSGPLHHGVVLAANTVVAALKLDLPQQEPPAPSVSAKAATKALQDTPRPSDAEVETDVWWAQRPVVEPRDPMPEVLAALHAALGAGRIDSSSASAVAHFVRADCLHIFWPAGVQTGLALIAFARYPVLPVRLACILRRCGQEVAAATIEHRLELKRRAG